MSELVPQTDINTSNVLPSNNTSTTDQQQPITILVAVDGSRVSRKALDTATSLCHGTNKNLIVYHIWNPAKKGIPGYYTAEYLEIEFENTCYEAGLKMRQFEISIESRGEDETIAEMILNKARETNADLLCLGAFGRKGPSVWASGSNAQHSLRRCPITVLTAKPNSNIVLGNNSALYMVGHDGSERAQKALEYVKQYAKPQDQVLVVNVLDEWLQAKGFQVEKLLQDAKTELENAGIQNGDARYFLRDKKIQIGRQLLNIASDVNATYIVVGLDGMAALKQGKEVLGSVSDFIVSKARCTTIIAR
jgi:nucleotide-binding universal stress UspA family protein